MKKFYLLSLFISILSMGISQYSITTIGATQTIDFTGFDGSGFSSTPAAGQLNSNEWEIIGASDGDNLFGQTNTTGDFARGASTGGVSTGGIYSFDNGTGASLGVQPGGSDLTPGSMTLAIINNTGSAIEEIDLEYNVWVYNDQARANSIIFEHGSDNVSFTPESAVDFTSVEAADASPAWSSETKTITITGLSIADGANYYLKWITDDVSGGGSRDEFAIDDISITGYSTGTPTITANPTLLTGFTQFVGSPSAEQTFEVSATSLTNDLVLNVTTGDYEISETSGSGFGTSITLTPTGGTVSATTIYVRLNGTVASSPSNGDITITSTGATDEVVNLEGEILNPAPTVFVTPSSLNGFSHFVGTPSIEQSIDVSGEFLTADIIVTAPTNYEVSLTSGSGFSNSVTLTQSGGTVSSTPVYVRLNGPTANYNQVGDIDVASSGATSETVALDGETLDYTPYDISEVTTNDADVSPDSLGVYVQIKGIVHCIDFDGDAGYSFTIIDSNNDGINVFNFNDVDGYVVNEGDSITVRGQIDFFNGLTQIFAEEIVLETQGNSIQTPTVVTALDETTESQYITIESLSLVNNETTWPSGGNVDVTDGNNSFVLRIDGDSPLAGASTPNGPFDVTGLGGQFDNSTPYDAGYQLYPCSINPLCNVDVTTATTNATATANASGTGITYQWIDCDNNDAAISGETDQSFTATTTGNYAVVITDGQCTDTSDCVNLEVCNVDVTTTTTDETIMANAAGLTYQWIDCDNNDEEMPGETGQSFTALANGNYAVIVTDGLCSDTSDCVTINTINLKGNTLMLSVYPNPVKDELTISSQGSAILNVSVISVTGQQVVNLVSNETVVSLNTSKWKTGVYFVEVKTINGSKIMKVIK